MTETWLKNLVMQSEGSLWNNSFHELHQPGYALQWQELNLLPSESEAEHHQYSKSEVFSEILWGGKHTMILSLYIFIFCIPSVQKLQMEKEMNFFTDLFIFNIVFEHPVALVHHSLTHTSPSPMQLNTAQNLSLI